jgi:prepilin-type N-terminal cleavage/methylation domain-containing protein
MKRQGFTLVEVMLALAITGTVALIARQLVSLTLTASRELGVRRETAAQQHNSQLWLAAAFLSLEVRAADGGFEGGPGDLVFSTWLQQPEGWFKRLRIGLTVRDDHLVAVAEDRVLVNLADSVRRLEVDYLMEAGANSRWSRRWVSPISGPLAVRLRLERIQHGKATMDTVILLIRERG